MKSLWRRTGFWIAYALLATAGAVVAAKYFPVALPIVSLEIKLGRDEAIEQARAIAARRSLAPSEARAAATFAHDAATQNYIELEGGGKAAWAALLAGDRYAAYWWEVRLFRAGDVDEVTLRFRPDGAVDGLLRKLPESYVRDPASRALSAGDARALAETGAQVDWAVDVARYRLLEQSEQTRSTGRVDHSFVYEQSDPIGEARIRMRLGVAGDELVEVTPFVHVPEAFDRRFQAMRSANNLIAGIASAGAGLVYGVGGILVGGLWLARRSWIVWRPALIAGLIVGGLLAAAVLAAAPAQWSIFDTAQSEATFWLRQAGQVLAIAIGGGLAYALIFMVAESLSRRAFPHHPQLWTLWSRAGGASMQTLGRTAGGYLFIPIELAFIVAFYYATNRWLGWWQPSESLTDPDILSSAVPALQPIALALQAGFMEECLFRAVPMALGAFIGARFGYRKTGIALAVVLQAVIFGAAHANYPGLPAYSRWVELMAPSVVWALMFLRFGLLPTILLHAGFDLALMSIPVFLVDAPGASLQRALVIAAGTVPWVVLLARRWQAEVFAELPEELRNGAWQPPKGAIGDDKATLAYQRAARGWAVLFQRALPVLGIAGLVGWALQVRVGSDVPPLPLSRSEAIAAAEHALAVAGVKLGPEWRRFADIRLAGDSATAREEHAFVWREAGPERYRALIGSYLRPPTWRLRFATFEGDVAARAEEWSVLIDGNSRVQAIIHLLPEARTGARLARDDALAIAEDALRERLGVDTAPLVSIGAQDKSLVARTDWSFDWRDPGVDVGTGGEARLRAIVLGDQPGAAARFVHVPETWLRVEREREGRLANLKLAAGIVAALAALVALIVGIVAWSRGRSDSRAMFAVGGLVLVVMVARTLLSWPQIEMSLRTAEPVATQLALRLAGGFVAALLLAVVAGVLAGVGAWWARSAPRQQLATVLPPWLAGIAAALMLAGLDGSLERLSPGLMPLWPSFDLEGTAAPPLAAAFNGLGLPMVAAIMYFLLSALARLARGGFRPAWWLPLLLASGFGVKSLGEGACVPVAMMVGLALGFAAAAVVEAVLRFDPRTVPSFVATTLVATAAGSALSKATVGAFGLGAIEIACILGAAWCVARYAERPLAGTAASGRAASATDPRS